jgi:hypothetical protein
MVPHGLLEELHVDALSLQVALEQVGLQASAYFCEYFPLQIRHSSSDRIIAKREAQRGGYLV